MWREDSTTLFHFTVFVVITDVRPVRPDGRRAAIGGWHGELLLLDVETGERVTLVDDAHGRDGVFWITFSPDGPFTDPSLEVVWRSDAP